MSYAFAYESTDVPVGMRLSDWRRAHNRPRRRGRVGRLLGLACEKGPAMSASLQIAALRHLADAQAQERPLPRRRRRRRLGRA